MFLLIVKGKCVQAIHLLYLLCLISGPLLRAEEVQTFKRENILGTTLEVQMVCESETVAKTAYENVLKEINRMSHIFNYRDSESELARLSTQQAGTRVKVSLEMSKALSLAAAGRKLGQGRYSLFSRKISELWKNAENDQTLPSGLELNAICSKIQKAEDSLILNKQSRTVTLGVSMKMDLDSMAKGMIIDSCLKVILKSKSVSSALVNIGGDIGTAGRGHAWQVDIQSPDGGGVMGSLLLTQGAVASSGGHHRYYQVKGKRYSHIVNARTGVPVDSLASATIVAKDVARADTLATIICLLGVEEGLQMINRIPSTECLLVDKLGKKHFSTSWKKSAIQKPAKVCAASLKDHSVKIAWSQNNSSEGKKFKRHFTVVWIENSKGEKVRDLALWHKRKKMKYLKSLKTWWSSGGRTMVSDQSVLNSISEATRRVGKYDLVWDHKDQSGKSLQPGIYTVNIEVNREKGPHKEKPSCVSVKFDTRKNVSEKGKSLPELDQVQVQSM